ncbi:lipopolysaccharide biosynthesis protein [Cupriavidus sp. CP313]
MNAAYFAGVLRNRLSWLSGRDALKNCGGHCDREAQGAQAIAEIPNEAGSAGVRGRFGNPVLLVSSGWGARIVAMCLQLLIVPVLTRSLGAEQFGAYALVASLMAWFSLTDIGLGVAVQNAIAERREKGQPIREIIGSACLCVVAAVLVVSCVSLPVAYLLAPFLFRNNPAVSATSGVLLLMAAGVFFSLATAGSVGSRLMYALGKGVTANLLQVAGAVVSFATVWISVRYASADNVLVGAFFSYAASLGLVGVVTLAMVFVKDGALPASAWLGQLRPLLPRARNAWIFALVGLLSFNIEYLVMSQILTATDISQYNVLYRLGWVWMSLYWTLLTAAWPTWSALGVRGRLDEITASARRLALVGVLGVTLETMALLLVRNDTFHWLFGANAPIPGAWETVLFGCYLAIRCWTEAHSFACQALNRQNVLIRITVAQAVVNAGLQYYLAMRMGFIGVLLGMICSSALIGAVWIPLFLRGARSSVESWKENK